MELLHKTAIQELINELENKKEEMEKSLFKDYKDLVKIDIENSFSIDMTKPDFFARDSVPINIESEIEIKRNDIDRLKTGISKLEKIIENIKNKFPDTEGGMAENEAFDRLDKEWLQKYSL
jgi:hypothetical protein